MRPLPDPIPPFPVPTNTHTDPAGIQGPPCTESFHVTETTNTKRLSLGGFLAVSRSMLVTLTHELWLVCCGRLTHGMLPGWCLCMPDSNLGPALPAGCSPATFYKSGSRMMIVRGAHSRWQGTSWRKKTGGEQRRGTGAEGVWGVGAGWRGVGGIVVVVVVVAAVVVGAVAVVWTLPSIRLVQPQTVPPCLFLTPRELAFPTYSQSRVKTKKRHSHVSSATQRTSAFCSGLCSFHCK